MTEHPIARAETAAKTFVPHEWNTATNQGAPAPWIPVVHGLRQDQYAAALESFGENEETGERTAGRGYGDRVTVITDPFTGNLGYVTQWEWNSRVEWGVWTRDGFERRGKSDCHMWMWDAVVCVREMLAYAAFTNATRRGEEVSYWAGVTDRESAKRAHDAWLERRLRNGVTRQA